MNGTIDSGEFEMYIDIRVVKQGYMGVDIPIINEFAFNLGIELVFISVIIFNIILARKKKRF